MSDSHNIRNQSPERRLQSYRRAQAKSLGNEYSRRNAQKALARDPNNRGLARLASRRAPAQTVLMEAPQARFSQQTVTANFTVTPQGTQSNIGQMSQSMQQHGFNRRFGPMKGSLVKNNVVSHDNRRLVSAKRANIWVPMKLEHPSIQNIDESSPNAAVRTSQRNNNSVNDFLINRTSPNRRAGPDPATMDRGYSRGFDSVKIRSAMEYQGVQLNRGQKRTTKQQAETSLINSHPSISGTAD